MERRHTHAGISARRAMTATLFASTAILAALPAVAQSLPAEDGAGTEIIVTATRRNESLQDVPISIQALGGETLDQQQVSSFDDYAKLLPSVSFQSFGPGQSQLFFRGISSGGDGLDAGSLPATGLYLDETPVTTIGGAVDLHIYDIARVEALSGPQGTLFGASSLSGTLRIITNKPDSSKFEGGYDLQLNKFGKGDFGGSAEGFLNIPLSERAALRVVGYYRRDGGYIDNTLGERTFTLGDLDDDTNLTVNNADLVEKNFNQVDSYGGRAALRIDLDDEWTATPSVVYQRQKSQGSFLYDPRAGDLEVHDFTKSENLDRWYQAALTIEGKIGNWDLVYSGGYFERKIDNQADYSYYTVAYDYPGYYYTNFPDGAGGFLDPTQSQVLDYKYTKHTQELRVSSPGDDRFRMTAGLFFQRQTNDIGGSYEVPGVGSVPRAGLPNLAPIPGFGDSLYLKAMDRVDRDYAMFGEASFDISPAFTLTAGIRGFIVNNTLFGFSGYNSAITAACLPTTDTSKPCINVDGKIVESGETHKVSLTWKVDDDRMIYATYSTGYRPGGVNRNPAYAPYKSDTISNYEVGWKTSWAGGRLRFNGAFFYEKWDDMQFGLARPGDNGVTSISNVGGSEVKGVEADILWRSNGLEVSASGTYLHAKTTSPFCEEDFSGNIACTPSGTRLPVQPRLKGIATARYNFDTGIGKSFVQGSVLHQSGTRSFLLDQEVAVVGYTDPFTTFDFSAGTAFSNMTVELFIQNAFDKRGQLSRNSSCAPAYCGVYARAYPVKPQMFGIKFGHRF
ncbi:TonB-dependent receptor [Sphingobium boeckii]|uniref:Outer membrane receptor protein involved in Fe transport n=1 Tax=Sphingobium boeckii TaxID=1082345 RepID=A0A7W9EEG0_9SPHN|nr:TonB-dependent receptor [Sphingobium boeckii]MBB5685999.1 outer membrane receptor protein involved in Fe transport [Sphingobium boeckii]